ncbi:MAG: hypothetical protein KAT43_01400 [Nanoarchaeota archaeon]|nr:hypothetical protein [Nanoarchaeota archaeon]
MKESQSITGKGPVKVKCSFCGKEIECPENMMHSKKHMCYDCFRNAGELAEGEDLEQIHVDIPMDKINEVLPENMTNSLVNEIFPDVWKERKDKFKAMSKRKLAEEMFGAGAYIAIQQMLATMTEDEKNPRKQDG